MVVRIHPLRPASKDLYTAHGNDQPVRISRLTVRMPVSAAGDTGSSPVVSTKNGGLLER